jgi:predicted acylesterase/phospholipase RssA/CRP-like cAMP-binding protein
MSFLASEKQLNVHSFYELQNTKLRSTLEHLFHTLDEAAITTLMAKLQWLEVRGGEVLFRQGEEGDSLYILVSGRMKAILEADTAEERLAGEISQGECVGEMALITGEMRAATVYAIRDCLLTHLSQEDFKQLMSEYPEVGISLSRLIINRLTHTMNHSKTPAKTFNIALVPASPEISLVTFVKQLLEALQQLGRVQYISKERLPASLKTNSSFSKEADFALHHWLTEQEMEQDYVIYLADDSHSPWTQKCLRQADKILIVVDAKSKVSLTELEREVLFNSKRKCAQTRELIVLYPEHTEVPYRTHELLVQREVSRHYNIRHNDEGHMQRLARMILDKGIGLVLSGGGAKGFAHLGIFRALQEAGVPIDMACGTSMGSIIAAAIAHEWNADEMLETGRSAFVRDKPLNDYTLPVISLLKGHKLQKINKKYFGEGHIENLWLNFFCVSGNYSTAEMVVLDKGPVWKAVTASVAIPGILPPVVEGNDLLIDGGIFNNFPVDIMKARFGGRLIGVDLLADKRYTLNYTQLPSGWTLILSKIFPFLKRYTVPSMASIIIKSTLMSSIVHQRSQISELEVAFSPPVAEFGLLDLKSYDKIVTAGYQYAKDYLQEIDIETQLLQRIKIRA